MITNQFISLEPESKERIEAQNIIKYTLLLDYKVPIVQADSEMFIQKILDQTQECCSKLFGYEPMIHNNFFGLPSSKCRGNLVRLDFFSNPVDSKTSKKASTSRSLRIHEMILQDSVMSAYHALLTEFLSSTKVSSYTLNKYFQKMGFYGALQGNYIRIEKNKIKLKFPRSNTYSSSNSRNSKASDLNDAFERRFLVATDFTNFLYEGTGDSKQYFLQYITLCNSLKRVSPAVLKHLHSNEITSSTLESFFDALISLTDELTPSLSSSALSSSPFSTCNYNIVDGMYQYYLAEKIYNHNLFASLLLNISRIKKQHNYDFENNTLEVLSSCRKLPNPFSRTFFLRYAFECIDDGFNSYQDYWNYHNINERNTLVKSVSEDKPGFHFDKWLLQFKRFVTYMSDHIMPIYDWCFVSMLLNAIEACYPNDTYLSHLQKALNLLAQYITQNYQKFLQPVKLDTDKEMEGLDIISPKNLILNDFSFQKVEYLRKLFFSSCDTELNLKPLDLALFRGEDSKNIRAIQDLYIDLRFHYS